MKNLISNCFKLILNSGLILLLTLLITQKGFSSNIQCASKSCPYPNQPCTTTPGSFTITYAQEIKWEANYFGSGGQGNDFYITTDLGNLIQVALSTNLSSGLNIGTQFLNPGTYHISVNHSGIGPGNYCIEYNRTASIGVSPTTHDFGDFQEGDSPSSWKTFTVSNTGDLDVNVTSITSSGDVSRFELDPPTYPDAPPTTFRIRYLPATTGAGSQSATFTVNATNPSGVTVSPVLVTVVGETELRVPDIDCNGSNCSGAPNLGTADGDVGESITFDKSFSNSGTGDLQITSITLVNDSPAAPFSLNGAATTTPLSSGSNRSVSIRFTPPPRENVYCGHLVITTNDPDESVKYCYFSARGYHPAPIMVVDELLLDYREVELGFSFTKAIIVKNAGDATLTGNVSDAACLGDPACSPNMAQWSLNETGAFSISPGAAPAIFRQTYTPNVLAAHTISLEVTGNDLSNPSDLVTLTGTGANPVPMDNMLVLDRSGSMNDVVGTGGQRKIDALMRAANLYLDLLRPEPGGTNTGDKIGFVKYNHNNSVYLPLNFKTPTNAAGTHTNVAEQALSTAAIGDLSRLKPNGWTGIGGAMQTGANQFPALSGGRSQIMVVMTDGIENRTPYIADVLGSIQTTKPELKIYSIGLGNQADLELAKLQRITNVANGFHQVSGDLMVENIFALEEFYFKIYSNANQMNLIVDPTNFQKITYDSVPRIIDKATVVSSDRYAVFLVLDDPGLRAYYNLELVDPNGHSIILGSTVGGVPVQVSQKLTYTIYKVIFPDISESASYVGDWVLRLTPNRKWNRKILSAFMDENTSYGQVVISPAYGYVPIGFGASVKSNYNMDVSVTATKYEPGATLTLIASLKDRGWPSTGGQVFVDVTNPNDQKVQNIRLFDDGTHGDSQPEDGLYTNQFIGTAFHGSYKCYFHGTGVNERGEQVTREATRYVSLIDPQSSSNPNSPIGRKPLRCSFHGGYTIPFGDFDRNHNWGSLFEIDIEYQFIDRVSLELAFGHYHFDPDYRLLGLIGYVKGYMNYGTWHPYMAAGGGIYRPSGGSFNSPGFSFGVGINKPMHQKLNGEFGIFYHNVRNDEIKIEFLGFKGGLKFHF